MYRYLHSLREKSKFFIFVVVYFLIDIHLDIPLSISAPPSASSTANTPLICPQRSRLEQQGESAPPSLVIPEAPERRPATPAYGYSKDHQNDFTQITLAIACDKTACSILSNRTVQVNLGRDLKMIFIVRKYATGKTYGPYTSILQPNNSITMLLD